MSACRESHDAHIVRIDAPHRGGVTHDTDAILHVAYRQSTVAIGKTVVNNEVGNTLSVEPF